MIADGFGAGDEVIDLVGGGAGVAASGIEESLELGKGQRDAVVGREADEEVIAAASGAE